MKHDRNLPLAGVLFDKDGTLIDFHATWGPAVHAMIHALADGDPALVQAQAEALHFSVGTRRFLATSPLIAGSTADYGRRWAEALGRADTDALKCEIDALSAVELLNALTPIGEPSGGFRRAAAHGSQARRRHQRFRGERPQADRARSASASLSSSSPATIRDTAASPIPAWRWLSLAFSRRTRRRSSWSAIPCTTSLRPGRRRGRYRGAVGAGGPRSARAACRFRAEQSGSAEASRPPRRLEVETRRPPAASDQTAAAFPVRIAGSRGETISVVKRLGPFAFLGASGCSNAR